MSGEEQRKTRILRKPASRMMVLAMLPMLCMAGGVSAQHRYKPRPEAWEQLTFRAFLEWTVGRMSSH
jgi:hypothetical protein